MLIFEKIDEVYFVVYPKKSEDYVELQELVFQFTLDHLEKQNMPDYRNGRWDGRVKFIKYIDRNKETAIAPIGLMLEMHKYMKKNGIEYEFVNDDFGVREIDLSDFDDWLINFEKNSKDKIRDRDYQYTSLKNCLNLNRCVLESPTGSGKTRIIYTYLAWILEHDFTENDKILLVVPSTNLVQQTHDDFVEYGMNKDIICKIYTGQEKNFNKTIIISTWESLQFKEIEFFEQFTILVVDEAHKAKAKKLMYISENCINARWRLATTGTVQKEQFYRYSIMSNFGMVITSSTTRELIDNGYLTDFHIRNIIFNWKSKENKVKRVEIDCFDDEFNIIIDNVERRKMMVRFICNLWDNREVENSTILVMAKRVEYIEELYKMTFEKNKNVYFIHGQISMKERTKVIDHVKKHGGIIICNVGIMGTGINIPNVTTVVFANPLKSDILLLQSIGRSIRLFEGKETAVIYDIIDKIPVKNKSENMTFHWLEDKTALYDSKHFTYDSINVDLIHDN